MKNKKLFFIVIGILVLLTINSYAETKKLKQIGRFTLFGIKGEVPTPEIMKNLFEQNAGDIKYGFDIAGYGDLYFSFIEQSKSTVFKEINMAIGDKFMWMLFRSNGKVKVVKDLEWAGKDPLPVFSFIVNKDYKNYEFVVPKQCGNISLVGIEEEIPDAVCSITVNPVKLNINDTVTVDMSGSQHSSSMSVEVFNASGTKVASKTMTPESPRWQTRLSDPGEYVFKATAVNLEGTPSTNPCESKVYVNFPPVSNIWASCLLCEDYVGRPITFDASNSTDEDGEVVKADFEITDASGNVVDTLTDSAAPFTWEKIFDKPGIYTITAVVRDDFGAMSKPSKLDVEVTQKRLFFLAEIGPLVAKGTYTMFLFTRIGMSYWIAPEKYSFILRAGSAFPLARVDLWKTFFTVDGLFNVHFNQVHLGVGIGYMSQEQEVRKGGLDILGNLGVKIFENYKTNGSIFFEGRLPVGSDRPIADMHKLVLGFRLIF